jgi:hypothetical protein
MNKQFLFISAWKHLLIAALFSCCVAHGAIFTYDFTGINATIPDGNANGYVNNQEITDGLQGQGTLEPYITDVTVRLNISGGWNGDLYGYVRHETSEGTGFTVLLNRVGTSGGNPLGYGDPGFGPDGSNNPFRLTDLNTYPDVHTYQSSSPTYNGNGQLTGTWRVDQTGSSVTFDSFDNLDPRGTWSIFFADLSGGNTSTLVSWGLEITAVPEPANVALGAFAVLIGGMKIWRRIGRKRLT